MTPFQSTSQYQQDEAIWLLSGRINNGTFLDIGAGQPVKDSNSCALERLGWTGHCIDNETDAPIEWVGRTAPLYREDATTFDYGRLERVRLENGEDLAYLSIDVDAASDVALARFFNTVEVDRPTFVTIEHDAYQGGEGRREVIRAIMEGYEYLPLCLDVYPSEQWKHIVWEDWFVIGPDEVDDSHYRAIKDLHNVEEIVEAIYRADEENE